MLGLFNSLDMAARSLDVQQQALEVAGHNLANANNPAYARESLVTSASPPLETPIGPEGTGVMATSILEYRNSFLDTQIQAQGGATASLTAQQSALQNAEAYLNEQIENSSGTAANSPNGLAANLSNLFNAFQSLSNNPSDVPTMQTVVGAAQALTAQFQQVSSQLSSLQAGLNKSIQTDVTSANQDLQDIADLNVQIMKANGSGSPNDLIDEREAKIEDLATKLNITTSVGTNGAIDISGPGGDALVTDNTVTNQLQTVANAAGNLTIQDTSGTNLTPTSGSIAGEISVRDNGLATLQSNLNTLASQLIAQVNAVYSTGYDQAGATGQNFFTGTNASDIAVNASLVADPSTFQTSGSASTTGDNTVVLQLANLANKNVAGLSGTFSQYYSTTVTALGDNISTVTGQLTNSQDAAQMLGNQRSSLGGVSIDQEMTDLIQYQKAYEASAELISTLNSMCQTVINMKVS